MIYKLLKMQENQTRQNRIFDDVQTRVCGFENSPQPGFLETRVSFSSRQLVIGQLIGRLKY